MKARDIMTADVIAVEADATVEEVARLLVQHRIGAVPVLDADRQVLGIVYQEQLFLRPKHVPFSTTKLPALLDTWVNPEELADEYQAIKQHPVAEIMREAVCVEADEKVGATAVLMAERDLSHVLVLTGDRLVGIISQTDIIELMTQD